MTGLDVARIVNVQVNMSPQAVPGRDFGMLCLLGSTNVIPISERMRTYSNMTDIGQDFGTTDPEYIAAQFWFSQSPTPVQLAVASYAQIATFSLLTGIMTTFNVATWTSITDGGFSLVIEGQEETFGGMDFSTVTTVQEVLSIVNQTINGSNLQLRYNNSRFEMQSTLSGSIEMSFLAAPAVGTNISGALGLAGGGDSRFEIGSDSETLLDAVQALLGKQWYALALALDRTPTDDEYMSIASLIEAASPSRMFGVTVQDPMTKNTNNADTLAGKLAALGLMKTFTHYSSYSPYAAVSYLARILTTDFYASNTTITMKFKQMPLITAETLTSSEADALESINCNVFVNYNNDTAIIQEGTMCNGYFTDEVYGLDWLQNAVQVAYFNVLYGAKKVPQTNSGLALFTVAVINVLNQAVTNGLLGSGTWTADSVEGLSTGSYLSSGFYVYMPDIATQAQAEREKRIAPTMVVCVKLAGAIHFGNVIINVNR